MSAQRAARLSKEAKKVLDSIIRRDVKDPRISPLVSIVRVDVTNDLQQMKVFISVIGSKEDEEKTLEGIKSAKGYIRKRLGSELRQRVVPELEFVKDTSIEYGAHINSILNTLDIKEEDEEENS